MAGFGENLRREREMRGISLEEISESTKISVRLLEALENEQFSKLPGGIFTRSFIRAYANYVGLDPDQVISEYHLIAPPKAEEDLSRLGGSGTFPKQKKRPSILPWIVAVVLLGGGYTIFRYTHRSTEAPLSFGNPPANAQAAASAAARPQDTSSLPAPQVLVLQSPIDRPGGSTKGSSATAPAASAVSGGAKQPPSAPIEAASATSTGGQAESGPSGLVAPLPQGGSSQPSLSPSAAAARGELVLQVAASQPSWIAVDADGKTVFQQVLAPHDTRTLVAKNSFDIITGNAGGTILTLNGVALKPLGDYGEVKKIHLTRADLAKPGP